MVVISAIIVMSILGVVLGVVLGYFSKKFFVKVDERIEKVTEMLPGVNCGTCGYGGCASLAEAIVLNNEEPSLCAPGGPENAIKIASFLGREAKVHARKSAMIFCKGSIQDSPLKYEYKGTQDCKFAMQLHGGSRQCSYGCIGLLNCTRVCPVGAIFVGKNGLPVVDRTKCISCGKCVKECPKKIIRIVPFDNKVHVVCSSKDSGAVTNKTCKVGCIACQLCVKACPTKAMSVEDNLARVDYMKCICCGKCKEVCPKKVIVKQ